jgi:coproporphyrinogen III oxidase
MCCSRTFLYTRFRKYSILVFLAGRKSNYRQVHANFRYFELYDKDNKVVDQWFGGGLMSKLKVVKNEWIFLK